MVFAQWLKTLTGTVCILTLLLNLVPRGKFAGYVRFYGGLLFFLIAVQPVLQLFAGEGELERMLRLEFLKEEYYDMETAVDGMAELKNDRIRAAYQQEILRQVGEIASACGLQVSDVSVTFETGDGYRIREISITAELSSAQSAAVGEARKELASVYQLEGRSIRIHG